MHSQKEQLTIITLVMETIGTVTSVRGLETRVTQLPWQQGNQEALT